MIHHALILLISIAVGCESSPQPKAPDGPARAPAFEGVRLDAPKLIQRAQELRDREFRATPTLAAVQQLDVAPLPGCQARCTQERDWLTRILFAGDPPVFPRPAAAFDPERNTIDYDGTLPASAARAAVLTELVRALDDVQVGVADSWDGYLASTAIRYGSGVFVATLDRASERNASIDAARLAMRPEGLYDLEFTHNRFADGFATREGFAFVAAMHRAGGWSTVELAHNERPTRTLEVVRPDRYLAGAQPGEWALPVELSTERSKLGYELVRDGRIGPALFAEWLAQRVPAAVARSAYIGFEADTYQLFAAGDDWMFDWVSLWVTPSVAQQVVEALDAGLRQRDDGAKFVVLRQGATVAVIGSSDSKADLTTPATALVGTLPVFRPAERRGVEFVPTPVDRIASRPLVSSIERAAWTDLATDLRLDLAALPDSWNIMPTQEPNLPWFAKHESGAVLQYLVEPQPLFDPDFDSPDYERVVAERFAATVASEAPPQVQRADMPATGTLVIDARGTIKDRTAEGEVQLRAWQFANGPFVTTLSLQASPDVFAARHAELDTLLDSIDVKSTGRAIDGGKIEFSVED